MSDKDIREASLGVPSRIAGRQDFDPARTKQLTNQRDLAMAYTPASRRRATEIVRDPIEARNLTAAWQSRLQ
jgi:malic enzyme